MKFHSFYHSHALVFSQYAYLVFIKTWKFWNWKFGIDFNPLLTPQTPSTPNSFLFTRPPISFGNEILFLATKRESQIIMPEYVWIKLRYSEKATKIWRNHLLSFDITLGKSKLRGRYFLKFCGLEYLYELITVKCNKIQRSQVWHLYFDTVGLNTSPKSNIIKIIFLTFHSSNLKSRATKTKYFWQDSDM